MDPRQPVGSYGRPFQQTSTLPLPPPYSIPAQSLERPVSSDNIAGLGGSRAAGLHGQSQDDDELSNRIRSLEAEVRGVRVEAVQARAALQREQQRSQLLASQVAGVEVDRLSWQKQLDEAQLQAHQLAQQLSETQQKCARAEEQSRAAQRALEAASIDRDAALSAKEDVAAQLRVVKKRLAEAEEEQYRAEEDTAALRAELRVLQEAESDISGSRGGADQLRQVEADRDAAKAQSQEYLAALHMEQSRLAFERQRGTGLQLERDEARKALAIAHEALEAQKGELARVLARAQQQLQEALQQAQAAQAQAAELMTRVSTMTVHAQAQAAAASSSVPEPTPPVAPLEATSLGEEGGPPRSPEEQPSRSTSPPEQQVLASAQSLDSWQPTVETHPPLPEGTVPQSARQVAPAQEAEDVAMHEQQQTPSVDAQTPAQEILSGGHVADSQGASSAAETGPPLPSPDAAAVAAAPAAAAPFEDKEVTILKEEAQAQQGRAAELEGQLAHTAALLEKQRQGRQKLLSEVDKQSVEIERLFSENAGLAAGFREASEIAARWELQLKECLQQCAELRAAVSELRNENARLSQSEGVRPAPREVSAGEPPSVGSPGALEALREEKLLLKAELAQAKTAADTLAGQVAQLEADNIKGMQTMSKLSRLYQPMLANIETKLLQVRQQPLPGAAVA